MPVGNVAGVQPQVHCARGSVPTASASSLLCCRGSCSLMQMGLPCPCSTSGHLFPCLRECPVPQVGPPVFPPLDRALRPFRL